MLSGIVSGSPPGRQRIPRDHGHGQWLVGRALVFGLCSRKVISSDGRASLPRVV